MRILIWSALGWLAVIPLAVANGCLREFVLTPRLGVAIAQPISGALLMAGIGIVVWMLVGGIGRHPWTTFLAIGVGWATATFVFEIALTIARGHGWKRALHQYTFADNNIWPLVMLWIAVAPPGLAWLRGRTLAA